MKKTKELLRARAKSIRDAISDDDREQGAHALKSRLNFLNMGIVGTYIPIGSEIRPPHSITNAQMALPVIRNKATLEFYRWSEGEPLTIRDFNIPIPGARGKTLIHPDALIMPLLMCDINGNRIGYGAGHYDRYIASAPNTPKLIGVCFESQIYDGDIPFEPHDKQLDLIITPKRVIEVS
jgi:5-formyltetrahydrofolate cyclo-ligase